VAVLMVLALVVAGAACSGSRRTKDSVDGTTTERPPASTTSTIPFDPASVPARPSPGCSRRSAREVVRGETESAIDSGGRTRTFFLRVPPAHDGRTPVPLVLDFHGFGEGAKVETVFSGMSELGMQQGFVTVVPQGSGVNEFWNTFGLDSPDDVGFTAALLDDLGDTLCIDLARVYVTGMSNGAFMASLLACRLADRVAAVAPVAGAQDPQPCTPNRPVPIMAFHGTADTFVPLAGGLGPGVVGLGVDPSVSMPNLGKQSVPDAMAAWAARNGCDRTPTKDKVAGDVVRSTWHRCRDRGDVVFYLVRGGGHTWPGSVLSQAAKELIGTTTMSIRADELIWAFFKDHPLA
jgi:polyhydroxybutyrate depolymerase